MGMLPHWLGECEMERDGGRGFLKFCCVLGMNVPLASFKQLCLNTAPAPAQRPQEALRDRIVPIFEKEKWSYGDRKEAVNTGSHIVTWQRYPPRPPECIPLETCCVPTLLTRTDKTPPSW